MYESGGPISKKLSFGYHAERLSWIDTAKGLGIVLVVFSHVWRGLENAGLIENAGLFLAVDTLVYAFHMPFFFFIAGIFFHDSLIRRPVLAFVQLRVTRLVWPLILWTWIFFLFKAAAGELANTPVSWDEFPLLPVPPVEQFWFLWALFLIQMAALCARPVLSRERSATMGWMVLGGIALLLHFGRPGVSEFGPWIIGAIIHSPHFVMGVIFGRAGMAAPSAGIGWLAFGLFLFVEAFAAELGKSPAGALAVGASATLLLAFALMALERWNRAARALGPLRAVGAASMAIYLAHVIFGSGLRVGLIAAGVRDLWVHAMLGTLIGVLGPLTLFLAARRSGVTRLLGF